MITIDIGIGVLLCKKDLKDKNKVFYTFKPNSIFDNKILEVLSQTDNLKESIENQLNKKLSEIYSSYER